MTLSSLQHKNRDDKNNRHTKIQAMLSAYLASVFEKGMETPAILLKATDKRLYKAKQNKDKNKNP